MIQVIKAKYDDGRSWFTSPKTLKNLLSDSNCCEMIIFFINANNQQDFDLLTNLSGSKVSIANEIIIIPELEDAF
jgi:hypothetical protein